MDFDEAVVIIHDREQKANFLVMDQPQSDACFVPACPTATAEALIDGPRLPLLWRRAAISAF